MTISKLSLLPLLALICFSSTAFAADAAIPELRLSPVEHPARETAFVPSVNEAFRPEPDPAWYVRAGSKKGLSGQADTDEERLIAPDTAILDRGFSAPWQSIMSAYQEPVVPVRPEEVAGIADSKPLLVIPSGALSGTGSSSFFKAALAAYAESGGIIFCLAQAKGADFSVLPVPQGQRLEAAGWSEDSGPLLGASSIPQPHPLLANLPAAAPLIETEGYFTVFPEGSQLLLVRADGFPTMLVYPFGKGWIVAAAVFSDFSALVGTLARDEEVLIRNLIAWSKKPGMQVPASAKTPSSEQNKSKAAATAGALPRSGPHLMISAVAERKDDLLKLSFEMRPPAEYLNQTVVIRTGEQEKSIILSNNKSVFSLEMPVPRGQRLGYAVYLSNGRAIARGSVAVPRSVRSGPAPDRTLYVPGDTANITIAGMGKGELTLEGMGFFDNLIVADRGSMQVSVPHDLPSGSYRIKWGFENIHGDRKQGEFAIDVAGYRARFENAILLRKNGDDPVLRNAKFEIKTDRQISGRLSVTLRGPDGRTVAAAEPVLSLVPGSQTVPVSFVFKPDQAGIWEMRYSLSTVLPNGAGIPSEPVALASGSLLFDMGKTAVLAVVPEKRFYYEPSGTVNATAIISGKGRATVEAGLDGKRFSREKVDLAGISRYHFSLPALNAGTHAVSVSIADSGLTASRERIVTYGLRLPDLRVAVKADGPKESNRGPVMPVTVQIKNQGKERAGASGVTLYEGAPTKGGKRITTLAVRALAPGEQFQTVFDWPLLDAGAGAHTLSAVVDEEGRLTESNRNNNSTGVQLTVPDFLLLINPENSGFSADHPVSLPLSVLNLTARSHKALTLDAGIQEPSGKRVSSQKIFIDELPGKSGKNFSPSFTLPSPRIGTYRLSAGLSADKQLAAAAADFRILPTLLLTGALSRTPPNAVLCKPFTMKYKIENAGNVWPTSGTVRLEIIPASPGQPPVYSKQFPVGPGEKSVTVESVEWSRGRYTARLTAFAANREEGLSREFMLAEQPLAVSGPVEVKRVNASFPRILAWIGRRGRTVEQAVSETIVKQALDQEDLYYKIVDSEQEFTAHAMTGRFNTYILFEPDALPARTDWLKERLERGQGLVITGSGEISRAVAEEFGFTFEESPARKEPDVIRFNDHSELGLSGNMPVSGRILYPKKQGAKTEAVFVGSGRAGALVDVQNGKIVLLPVSFSQSALNGPALLYSLVLRKAAFFVSPDANEETGIQSGQLSLSSLTGQVRARIRELLGPGSQVVWTSREGKADKNTITYELKADKEPKNLLYLYQPPASGRTAPRTEIYYQCGDNFVSQGKIE